LEQAQVLAGPNAGPRLGRSMYPSSEIVMLAATFVIGRSSLVVAIISQDPCGRRSRSVLEAPDSR
jgi:hypothetical protein